MILALLAGCQPARPQLVVTVNADLPLPSAVVADEALSASAAIDRVRVEVLSADGAIRDARLFVEPPPLSFGLVPPAGGGPVRLRVTGFRATRQRHDGAPLPGTVIDRLYLANVTSVQAIDLVLRGDCMGRPSDPAAGTTCLDGARPAAPALGAADAPAIEPWAPARATPCAGSAPTGMVCIPGGASVIGDAELSSVDATSDLVVSPPRMVVLSPFYMDTTEVTVAQLRALVKSGQVPAPPTGSGCNYTPTPATAELEAVRCVPFAIAREACKALGFQLPTAAQWEHAARGRGRELRYPWGDAPPTCATAALATPFGCPFIRNVGTHAADTSRDGVRDLGGSVREWVLDGPIDFDTCLGPGVLTDPLCAGSGGSTKGGSLDTPLEGALAAPRRGDTPTADIGFRCVL